MSSIESDSRSYLSTYSDEDFSFDDRDNESFLDELSSTNSSLQENGFDEDWLPSDEDGEDGTLEIHANVSNLHRYTSLSHGNVSRYCI